MLEATLNAMRFVMFDEVFRAGRVQDDTRVDARSDVERDAVRDVRLDEARDDVGRRSLGRDDEVDSRRARQLSDTADGELNLFAYVHHQIGKLIDDDDDVGKLVVVFPGFEILACLLGGLRLGLRLLNLRVELSDVSRSDL